MRCINLLVGAGGFTENACLAGVRVVWATNHWPLAVQYHQTNHPDTRHECQDLQQADWRAVPAHDVVLASPACQGHSRARGRERPHHDMLRNTAWAVAACAECHRSPVILVENVPDFEKRVLYPVWRDALRRLGYAVSSHLVDAADHGVLQNRQRLFLVCMHSRRPLCLSLPCREHRPITDVIQWDTHPWSPIAMSRRSEKTLHQITTGRVAHGDRFLIPYYSSGSGLTSRSIHRPVGTITTRDRWAVIEGDRIRMFAVPEARNAMSFPPSYVLPNVHHDAMHLPGNVVYPVVAADFPNELHLAA